MWCKLLILLFFLCVLLYFFIFYLIEEDDSKEEEEVDGWGYNTSRDPLHYLTLLAQILPKNFCKKPTLLTVIILSSPGNRKRRNLLRRTYRQSNTIVRSEISVFFLLGLTLEQSLQEEIEEESRNFDDIIQENVLDVYNNLSLKSLSMLKEYFLHCKRSKYLMKADDDTFINFGNIQQMLMKKNSSDLLLGHLFCGAKPDRNSLSKWYTPYYLYSKPTYPKYLSGQAYLISSEIAKEIYQTAIKTDILHIEDIYVTGICAEKLGIVPRHSAKFSKKKKISDFCMIKDLYTIADTSLEEFLKISSVLSRGGGDCDRREWTFWWIFDNFFKIRNPFNYRNFCF